MSFEPLDNLNGQTAVIAGAMGGIGYATAQRLADRGARIIGLVRRNIETAQQRLDQLPNSHLKHRVILTDVTDRDQLSLARNQIDRCDILVNASGSSVHIPHFRIDLLSDKIFDNTLTDNLRSQFSVIRTFLPLIKQSPSGLIVNLGSTAGTGTGGSNIAYAAAKGGLRNVSQQLGCEWADRGVRVNSVSPGFIMTEMGRKDSSLHRTFAHAVVSQELWRG